MQRLPHLPRRPAAGPAVAGVASRPGLRSTSRRPIRPPGLPDTFTRPSYRAGGIDDQSARPAPPHIARPWRRLRLQARPHRAAGADRARAVSPDPAEPPRGPRDRRRRRRLAPQRHSGAGRDHRFLHPHRRRPARFRPHRRGQRAVRRLCDGGHADYGAGPARHAARGAIHRGRGRDPCRRRLDLCRGRHPGRGRPLDRQSRTDLRPGSPRPGRSASHSPQRRRAARRRADPHQGARHRHLQRGPEAGRTHAAALRRHDRIHHEAERDRPASRRERCRSRSNRRHRLRAARPHAGNVPRERSRSRDRAGSPALPARGRTSRARGFLDRRCRTQLGELRRRHSPARRMSGLAAQPPVRPADERRPPRGGGAGRGRGAARRVARGRPRPRRDRGTRATGRARDHRALIIHLPASAAAAGSAPPSRSSARSPPA